MSIFERNRGIPFSKSNPVSFALIIIITFVFILQQTALGSTIFSYGALQGYVVIYNGDWWRIITVIFLHGGITHYVFNTFFGIYVISGALERIVGPVKFLAFFFGGGIIASFAVVGWDIMMENTAPTVGASGAIFAVLGVLLFLIINKPQWFSASDATSIKAFVIINVIFTFLGANISIPGHIGGLIAGYLLAFFIPMKRIYSKHGSDDFSDPFERTYIDPASLDDVEIVDDDDDDDPFRNYPS